MGAVAPRKFEPHPGTALVGQQAGSSRRPGRSGHRDPQRDATPRIEVAIVAATHRRLDGDNLAAGYKPLRDAIAAWLGVDDTDDVVEWSYGQVRCSGDEGTIVTVRINP